jgi:hypothetical protein
MSSSNLKRTLLLDLAIAALIVIFVLVVAPGLALVGLVALLVLVVGAASIALEVGHARRRSRL